MRGQNALLSNWLSRNVAGMERRYVWASVYSLDFLAKWLFATAVVGLVGLWRSDFTSKVLWTQVVVLVLLWLLARFHFRLVLDDTKGFRSLAAAYRCWDVSLIILVVFLISYHFIHGAYSLVAVAFSWLDLVAVLCSPVVALCFMWSAWRLGIAMTNVGKIRDHAQLGASTPESEAIWSAYKSKWLVPEPPLDSSVTG